MLSLPEFVLLAKFVGALYELLQVHALVDQQIRGGVERASQRRSHPDPKQALVISENEQTRKRDTQDPIGKECDHSTCLLLASGTYHRHRYALSRIKDHKEVKDEPYLLDLKHDSWNIGVNCNDWGFKDK